MSWLGLVGSHIRQVVGACRQGMRRRCIKRPPHRPPNPTGDAAGVETVGPPVEPALYPQNCGGDGVLAAATFTTTSLRARLELWRGRRTGVRTAATGSESDGNAPLSKSAQTLTREKAGCGERYVSQGSFGVAEVRLRGLASARASEFNILGVGEAEPRSVLLTGEGDRV